MASTTPASSIDSNIFSTMPCPADKFRSLSTAGGHGCDPCGDVGRDRQCIGVFCRRVLIASTVVDSTGNRPVVGGQLDVFDRPVVVVERHCERPTHLGRHHIDR